MTSPVFCPKCGAATVPGAAFCASCGTPISAPTAWAAPAKATPAPVTKGLGKRILIVAAVLIGLAGIGSLTRPGGGADTDAPRGTARPVTATTNPNRLPAGFLYWPADDSLGYKAIDVTCEIADKCYGIQVLAMEGCSTSLYAEVALTDAAGVSVGYSNDTTGKLAPGQEAKLTFEIFEEDATNVKVSELSCY